MLLRDTQKNHFMMMFYSAAIELYFSHFSDYVGCHFLFFLPLNCVLGQDTEIGILKRHIMHVSHEPYESLPFLLRHTAKLERSDEEFMWGRAWHFKHLTPLNGGVKSITGIPLGMAWESFIESRNFNEKSRRPQIVVSDRKRSRVSYEHKKPRDCVTLQLPRRFEWALREAKKRRPEWGNKFSCENSQARHHNDLRKNMKMK